MIWLRKYLTKITLPLLGFSALVWFLIRVIPKPSRAVYPCQRAAFPLAASFIIWFSGISLSLVSFRKARKMFDRLKNLYAITYLLVALCIFAASGLLLPGKVLFGIELRRNTYQAGLIPAVPLKMEILDEPVVFPSATVSVIRSGETLAEQISFEEVLSMVRRAVNEAGGLENIVENLDEVILKPNLVGLPETWLEEYTEVNGKTTDWRVTRAVAMLVREINPDGKIFVMEGSGSQSTRQIMEKLNYDSIHIPEVDGFICLEEESGEYGDEGSTKLYGKFLHPDERLYPVDLMPGKSPLYYLNKQYYHADVLISIPVLKNHDAASFTGSIKNVGIGATPASIYGNSSSEIGRWNIISHNPAELHQWIHDYYLSRPVEFVVVDGLQGMENGPTEREYQTGIKLREVQKNMRVIIAGRNAVATDAIAALIIAQDPTLVNHLVHLNNSGLGTINPARIRVTGTSVQSIREPFWHWSEVAKSSMFDDFTPPVFEVNSCSVIDKQVFIDLSAGQDVVKVEVAVQGRFLKQIAIDRFDSIVMDLDTILPANKEDIVIYSYDRYLNSSYRTAENQEITGTGLQTEEDFISLGQNFPNPFSGSTTIPFHISSPGNVSLRIFDIGGHEVSVLLEQYMPAGDHSITWNAAYIPKGIYIYILESEDNTISRRMVVQ